MAEPMREHVERLATLHGWKPEDGEGALEFCFRMHYRQGKEDATPQAAGGEPDAWMHTYKKGDRTTWVADIGADHIPEFVAYTLVGVRPLYLDPPVVGQEWVVSDKMVDSAIRAYAEVRGYPPYLDDSGKSAMKAAIGAALISGASQ